MEKPILGKAADFETSIVRVSSRFDLLVCLHYRMFSFANSIEVLLFERVTFLQSLIDFDFCLWNGPSLFCNEMINWRHDFSVLLG